VIDNRMRTKKVLLTGATGALGSRLCGDALAQGLPVLALVRAPDEQAARQRLATVLGASGLRHNEGALEVCAGDILREDLALDGRDLSGVDVVVHCAADVSFDPAGAESSWQTNVAGTTHVLALAERLGARMVHVSTAYVAGRRRDRVREDDLQAGQEFNNAYERTKCHAEQLVRDWSARTGLSATVLRPSIVVGDSRNGRIARFNTLYDILHAFEIVSRRRVQEPIRVAGRTDATFNFVPVDYFSAAAWRIISTERPGTYHVVHPHPATLGRMADIFRRLFDVDVRFVEEDEFQRVAPTPAERLYRTASSIYQPYMSGEPVFDRTRIDEVLAGSGLAPPELDEPFFRTLLAYARSVDWGRTARAARAPASPPPWVTTYFEEFLVTRLHQQLVPDLRGLNVTFRIRLREVPHCHWALAIRQGCLEEISSDGLASQCQFTLDLATFEQIVSGRLSPQKAFFARRADIDGEVEVALKLVFALGMFFRQYPFESRRT